MVETGVALRRDIAGALRRARPDIVITMNFDLTWGDEGQSTTPTTAPQG